MQQSFMVNTIPNMIEIENKVDPATARMRRIQLRQKRSRVEDEDEAKISDCDTSCDEEKDENKRAKKQARYEPETATNMTKDELSAWRKEARRVRNRESAAASRQKTRQRIDELEGEVAVLQTKYKAALQFILRQEEIGECVDSLIPDVIREDLSRVKTDGEISVPSQSLPHEVCSSPLSTRVTYNRAQSVTISPPLSPVLSSQIVTVDFHGVSNQGIVSSLIRTDSRVQANVDVVPEEVSMIQPIIISRPTAD